MPAAFPAPRRAVWELTWACNLRCAHCLVEGGPRGRPELDPDQALSLCDELAALGVRVVTLTGGEPLFRPDWAQIGRRLRDHGLGLMLSSNGHLLDGPRLKTALDLEIQRVALSLDGLADTHDALRRFPVERTRRSSFAEVVATIHRLGDTPIEVEVITTINPENQHQLIDLHRFLKTLPISRWMVQRSHATGRGKAQSGKIDLPRVAEQLARLSRDPALPPVVHHSIGWLGPLEPLLRQSGRPYRWTAWRGSPCGRNMLAIEPDGGIKGCPNQVGAPFVVGHVPEEPLPVIWADRARWHWLDPDPAEARGACAPCGLKTICQGGCPCVSVASTGHLFDQPECLRALARAGAPA